MANDILLVDDEDDIRSVMADILGDEGFETRQANSSQSAMREIAARRPTLVVLDIWMDRSELDGLQTLRVIQREHPDLPVVMISGHGTIETAVEALRYGAYDFIEKPFKTDRLLTIIRRAIESATLRREVQELRVRAGTEPAMVGNSPPGNALRNAIEKVAKTGSRVIISGPPGSGKELVARLLHMKSVRANGPFMVLNCAVLRPDSLEEELFGVETQKGVKTGILERSHGGTLLLDEVADMPLATQGKIVRVLQDQTFERVGGNERVSVDVRVLASSAKQLTQAIDAGDFREDLYYRLNVVPLQVPALKERRTDIPVIAEHFMQRAAETAGLARREISDEAMAVLQSYNWPGNARQLRNIVERLLIMAPGEKNDPIRADMLPSELFDEAPKAFSFGTTSEIMGLPLREARELFEREYLVTQVNRFGGNISRTANFVGMERSALHRKLKSLGITTDRSANS